MAKRISDLDTIIDEAIDLSQYLPIDDPTQTFKLNLLQLSDFLFSRHMETIYPVGSTLYRVDTVAPTTLGYPGTWTKVAENVTLATGLAAGSDVGSVAGNNTPAVPLLSHSHTATTTSSQAAHTHSVWQDAHTHSATQGTHTHTATQPPHSHNVNARIKADYLLDGGWNTGSTAGGAAEHHQDTNLGPTTTSATPAITVAATSAGAITVNSVQPTVHADSVAPAVTSTTSITASGVASPVIDVQGLHLNGTLWIRTE